MLYVFQLKPFKQKNFEKLQVFLAEFFQKIIFFQWKQIKINFFLKFLFRFLW